MREDSLLAVTLHCNCLFISQCLLRVYKLLECSVCTQISMECLVSTKELFNKYQLNKWKVLYLFPLTNTVISNKSFLTY